MPTLDIWSNSATWRLRGLIQSSIANLLLLKKCDRPIYLCSPWISDFPVFDNSHRQFSPLVPHAGDKLRINLSDCLSHLARENEVRIVSKKTETTQLFCGIPAIESSGVHVRMSNDKLHEKGILTQLFYVEGSMNVTFAGVRLNAEKVVFHAGDDPSTRARIQNAYLEFNRRWGLLA